MVGVPHAMDSTIGRQKPSYSDGITARVAPFTSVARSESLSARVKTTLAREPSQLAASARMSSYSQPSGPASTRSKSRLRFCSSTARYAWISRLRFLYPLITPWCTMYGRVIPSFCSSPLCNSGSGGAQLKLSWSQPRYTTETFDSGTLYRRTRSDLEFCESVITCCDNLAPDQ